VGLGNSELALIQEAIGSGVILSIRYDGGSDPGSYRDIQPNKITDTMVWAYCHTSKAVKQFALSKIGSVTSVPKGRVPSEIWTPKSNIPRYEDLVSYFNEVVTKWKSDVWNCHYSGDEDVHSIEVIEQFKNGKPRKTPSISLGYEKWAVDFVLMQNGDLVTQRVGLKSKQFSVRGKGRTTVVFSKIDSAIERFEGWVGEL
jgi:predicted DNA-binding transcriptional regulator YafY